MVKGYMGLDVHKQKIVIGVAESGDGPATIHGKCSSDIRVFTKSLRKLLKSHGWSKDEVIPAS